jgi:type II secretory ATPase GspE/PulE/Tfp pilus assembly ATPase PilB-like protein
MFQSSNSGSFLYKSQPESFSSEDNAKELDRKLEQTFDLIDSFLSLRHCLFYQVLPLEVHDNCLTLGMVNLENKQALNYLEFLVADRNYSLNKKQIDWRTFQSIVLAYSSHSRTNKNKQETNKIEAVAPETKISRSIEQLKTKLVTTNPLQDRPTLIISSPKKLNIEDSNSLSIEENANVLDKKTEKASFDRSLENIPSLEVQAIYLEAPAEFLTTLSPQLLWRELLGRMLGVGVGKLRFERQQDFGCITLSQNGVTHLSINKLDLQLFQGVLSEFKYLAKLPISFVREVRRGELLRCYKKEKLLLSWQISPSQFGEEAMLHVLRGNALKFYQQKQMDDIGEQALQLAKTLESKLNQIQTLREMNSAPIRQLASLRQVQTDISLYLRSLQ